MRCRYVVPDTKKYDLSDGDWIEFKKFLNAGEQKRLEGAGVSTMRRDRDDQGPAFDLNYERLGLGRIEIYTVKWSFINAAGDQTQPEFATIAALDPDTIKEIDAVLDKHVAAMAEEKKGQKPATAGAAS